MALMILKIFIAINFSKNNCWKGLELRFTVHMNFSLITEDSNGLHQLIQAFILQPIDDLASCILMDERGSGASTMILGIDQGNELKIGIGTSQVN